MLKKKRIASLTKKVLAVTLAVATVMMNGYGLQMFRDSEVKAEASTTEVLSNEDRGVIYSNSRTDFRDETIYFLL